MPSPRHDAGLKADFGARDDKEQRVIAGAIFDVDGTLLDSMPTWHNCGARYLATLGIEAEPGLGDILFTHTSETAALYLIDRYKLDKDPGEVARGLSEQMEHYYYEEASMKPGAREFLDKLESEGVPMTVATSTDRYCIEAAFEKLDLSHYFLKVLTCPEVGATKSEPLIFEKCAEVTGSEPEETWVFEDGLYAIKTAADAGFRTAAIYDDVSREDFDEMSRLADISVMSFDELAEKF